VPTAGAFAANAGGHGGGKKAAAGTCPAAATAHQNVAVTVSVAERGAWKRMG
jgi:hypothetical protein